MKNLVTKKNIITTLVVIFVVVVGWITFVGDKEISYDTVVAVKENLIQEISVTGRVEAVESIDLAFENSGRVSRTYVEVGDRAYVGQDLVALENGEELAQVAQAEAKLAKDQAKLAELIGGAKPEEIQVQEVKVANAESALKDANRKLVDELKDAYTRTDDAVRNKTDQFFSNPQTSNPQLNFATNSQFESSVESGRFTIEGVLQEWSISIDILTADEVNQNLERINFFLSEVGLVVNAITPNINLTQATIDAWRLDVFTGRTNVNTAIANITAAEEKVENAKSSLALAEQELVLKRSGTKEELIAAQNAQVKESEANVSYYKAQVGKTVIYSSIRGIVTVQNAKVGEIVPANTLVVSVISEAEYQIEALVVEADITNLEVGDIATLSLDAYDEDVLFKAVVVKINPAAELTDGVANYRTTLKLSEEYERIRAGMTVDLDIVTAERENVVVVPHRAVIFKEGLKLVRVLREGDVLEEVEVETGITGGRGLIEVISGIKEGDIVVTAIKD